MLIAGQWYLVEMKQAEQSLKYRHSIGDKGTIVFTKYLF